MWPLAYQAGEKYRLLVGERDINMSKYGHKTINWFESVINVVGGEERAEALIRGELMVAEKATGEIPPINKMRGRKVSLWLHDEQKDGGWIEGHKLYEHLKSNNMLESCLGLRDLEEIQRRGIEFFRQHFKGKAVFGWKSAVRDSDGNLNAPCLYEGVGRVVLDWVWLSNGWSDCSPALRFAK